MSLSKMIAFSTLLFLCSALTAESKVNTYRIAFIKGMPAESTADVTSYQAFIELMICNKLTSKDSLALVLLDASSKTINLGRFQESKYQRELMEQHRLDILIIPEFKKQGDFLLTNLHTVIRKKDSYLRNKLDFNLSIDELFTRSNDIPNGLVNYLAKEGMVSADALMCQPIYRSTTLLVDCSGSMDEHHKLDLVRDAAVQVIDELSSFSELAIIGFSGQCTHNPLDAITVLHPFSSDKESLKASLSRLSAKGGTPLSNAIQGSMIYMEKAHRGEVGKLIVLGDGEDDCNNVTGAIDKIQSSEFKVAFDAIDLTTDAKDREVDLKRIAEALQGQYYNLNFENFIEWTTKRLTGNQPPKEIWDNPTVEFLGY